MIRSTFNFLIIIISIISTQRQDVHDQLAQRKEWFDTYDFVIIGAGSAGCVMASRLSEIRDVKVLLLEAGGPQTVISDMPGRSIFLRNTEIDWGYRYEPQQFTGFAYMNRQFAVPRGKVFGGTSVINNMNYNRGSKRDYDNWAFNFGAKGWSYDEILPYYKKSENNTDPHIVENNSRYHATGGLLGVSSTLGNNRILQEFIRIANETFGYPIVDINGRGQYGVAILQQTVREGIRQSSATAFLEPRNVRMRRNLHTVGNAFVTKIIFRSCNNGTRMASGVEFYKNGIKHTVKALKEVILSAGAYDSPQLLMLSGIGPKEHLREFNIPLVADLPVGNNYQNHPGVILNYDVNDQTLVPAKTLSVDNLFDFFVKNSGPLAYYSQAIINKNADDRSDVSWPDGYAFINTNFLPNDIERIVAPYEDKPGWRRYFQPYVGRIRLTQNVGLSRPKSIGTIRLGSKDPFDPPVINSNILSDPRDADTIVGLIRKGLQVLQSPQFRFYATMYNTTMPNCSPCNGNDYMCESYLRCLVRDLTINYVHPCCTCRMGRANDPKAVTDERLRVKKVRSLRVIDASVMPQVTSGNTNGPTIMIAEKASDMIKEDWNLR